MLTRLPVDLFNLSHLGIWAGHGPRQSCDQSCDEMVGVGRFELPTPCSRSRCATRLRYTPLAEEPWYIDGSARRGKEAGQERPCMRCSTDAMLVGGRELTIFLGASAAAVSSADGRAAFQDANGLGRGQAVRQRVLVP